MVEYDDNKLLYEIMIVLGEISLTLKSMKEQEKEYWETWKKSKEKEG